MRILSVTMMLVAVLMFFSAEAYSVVTQVQIDRAKKLVDEKKESTTEKDIVEILGKPDRSKLVLGAHYLVYKTDKNEQLFLIDTKGIISPKGASYQVVDPDNKLLNGIFAIKVDQRGIPLDDEGKPIPTEEEIEKARKKEPVSTGPSKKDLLVMKYLVEADFQAERVTPNLPKAIVYYTMAIEVNPKLAEAYAGRANVYNKLGNYKAAAADYDKAMEYITEDDDPEQLCAKAVLFILTCKDTRYRDGKRAIQYAEKGVAFSNKLSRWDKNSRLESLDLLASAHAQAGNFEKAVALETEVYNQYKAWSDREEKTKNEFKELIEVFKAHKTYTDWKEAHDKEDKDQKN